MSTISLAIAGAAGRMGRRLIALAQEQSELFCLAAALDAPSCPLLLQDAGTVAGAKPSGIAITSTLSSEARPDVIIDFSVPAATRALVPLCVERKIAMVIGTTGLTAADHEMFDRAAQTTAILQATNTSLGVNVLFAVAAQIARQLGDAYDIEIVEAHHNQKRDAPSGTALSLAESICAATGRDPGGGVGGEGGDLVHGRHGHNVPRKKGTIGMHAIRMGDVVGEHTIYYATPGERIEVRHVATNRDTFVRGALRAAAFMARAKPGRYTMKDVLGI